MLNYTGPQKSCLNFICDQAILKNFEPLNPNPVSAFPLAERKSLKSFLKSWKFQASLK